MANEPCPQCGAPLPDDGICEYHISKQNKQAPVATKPTYQTTPTAPIRSTTPIHTNYKPDPKKFKDEHIYEAAIVLYFVASMVKVIGYNWGVITTDPAFAFGAQIVAFPCAIYAGFGLYKRGHKIVGLANLVISLAIAFDLYTLAHLF